mmetsp:Transcript_10691/g.32675  ORF Transcript_10691/g.32675 Transcript_10691/m.32675 type:complete len:219 (-) Transcript_10691:585-1241(-)
MVLARSWGGADHLHAAVRRVVCPFPLLSVIVPHIVRILLLELIPRNLGCECCFPELQGLLEGEPDALQEKSKLHPSLVFQVIVRHQGGVEVLHAHGKVPLGKVWYLVQRYDRVSTRLDLSVVRGPLVLLGQKRHDWGEPVGLVSGGHVGPRLRCDLECLRQVFLEAPDDQRRHLVRAYICPAPVDEDPPRGNQGGHSLERHFEKLAVRARNLPAVGRC